MERKKSSHYWNAVDARGGRPLTSEALKRNSTEFMLESPVVTVQIENTVATNCAQQICKPSTGVLRSPQPFFALSVWPISLARVIVRSR